MSRSEKFWNKLSKNYDKKAKDKTFVQILDRTPRYLRSEDIVLDFACATGLYSFDFVNNVKEIQAFDTSSKMINFAKNKARKEGVDKITFSQTTLFDKKYKEGTFDVILAFNILLYFKDIEIVLDQMNKLLKPDGLIITSTACLKERRTLIGILSGGAISFMKNMEILPYINFLRIGELKASIANCRFNIIESEILIEKPAAEYFIVAKKSQ